MKVMAWARDVKAQNRDETLMHRDRDVKTGAPRPHPTVMAAYRRVDDL